ncbi:hypothetical protein Drorol1_Dr00015456 [Drosera rotundifolia]
MSTLTITLCLTLTITLLSPWPCLGQTSQETGWRHQRVQAQEGRCDIRRLTATEARRRIRAEGGVTEIWDAEDQQFRCAGVAALRHVIEPGGLFLPSYTNAPYLTYVVQGSGIQGVIMPGCPETYQSVPATTRQGRRGEGGEGRSVGDQHQKVVRIRKGDVIASPAGVVQWTYNDGDTAIVSVTLLDMSNSQNQLDRNIRGFYLAGNPQRGEHGRQERQERSERGERGERGSEKESSGHNILSGFDEELLAEAFGVDIETARKMQGRNDDRGNIIRVKRHGLKILSPELEEKEWKEQRGRRRYEDNGLEESICAMKFRHNIDKSTHTDIFDGNGGRASFLNSQNLPILKFLQLSAEKVVLNENAMMVPHWKINGHGIMYITRGSGRIQVVRDNGELVFDDRVQEGQLLVIPQNYVAMKKAGREGLEWVGFGTSNHPMISPLSGRLSIIKAIPEEVLMNSYDISREQTRRLKSSGRQEMTLFTPGRSRDPYSIV